MNIWQFVVQVTVILNSFKCIQSFPDEDPEDTTGYVDDEGPEVTTGYVPVYDEYKKVLAQVLFRHGDRSPVHSYANDEYTEADWPQGYGQLSIKGMQQEYVLGAFLRERYTSCQGLTINEESCLKLLSEDYKRAEVYVRSTSYDRTLMSAYSVLSALFPPPFREQDTSSMGSAELFSVWQPIPVHTVPMEEDYLLGIGKCEMFNKLMNETLMNLTNPRMQEMLSEYSELFAHVAEHSGEPNSVKGMDKVLDPLFCEYVSQDTGKTLPSWVREDTDVLGQLLELRDMYAEFSVPGTFAYLKGGSLLKEMINHMIGKVNDTVAQRLFLYSAHDTTVIALLQTMGLFNYKAPPYTACILVELLEKDSDYFVQILYRNDSNSEPYVIEINDCGTKCPLQMFVDKYLPSLPENIVEACRGTGLNNVNEYVTNYVNENLSPVTVLNVILASVIVLTLISFLICYFFKETSGRSSAKYMPVPTEMSDLS
ncbi:prostatic acid phosphatase-like isoform X2 [Dreissena polymorpha]|uniref:acid phosphatase n=2 Tax=Dreissena polymorpha TaxID=45954 RepID=A0A9D4KJ13_DREPO|nr:prostatic acid phosphatase-like isoform X2 [Dreissena polymorpha]KAH3840399.1 hypothetical protein DPMN_113847 [Dreissena polymorpha]